MFEGQYQKLELIGEILGLLRYPSKNSSLLIENFINYLELYEPNWQFAQNFINLLDEEIPKDIEQLVHSSGKDTNTVRATLRALKNGGAVEVEKGGVNGCKNFYLKKRKNPISKSARYLKGIEDNPWSEERSNIYEYYKKQLLKGSKKQAAIRSTAHRFGSGATIISQLIETLEKSLE